MAKPFCFYIAVARFVDSSFNVLNWHWLLAPEGSTKILLLSLQHLAAHSG
jgi:hypothetical protein